jgi:UTP--glucose-1-phosphate uridylyltransferase
MSGGMAGTREQLRGDLAKLAPELLASLRARGFDAARLVAWSSLIGQAEDALNRLPGLVEPPSTGDVVDAPRRGTAEHARLSTIGAAAIERGEVALCVLAGGMATRMGGVVKALVEALPGRTFLDLRLDEQARLTKHYSTPAPMWLMTSEATDAPLREALGERRDGEHVATFEQDVSLRLTPEGALFMGDDGAPSIYATGHGDLPDALRRSGLLTRFLARGGRYVWIANLDNLGATVDAALLGRHIEGGAKLTVELVDKVGSDRGGGPIRWNGRKVIAEEFRLPRDFDPTRVSVFNTNTFLVDARALSELSMPWTYVKVDKASGERRAVQFERLLGELTTALEPDFVRVPRDGSASRFLPVKDRAELAQRRPEIEAIVQARTNDA